MIPDLAVPRTLRGLYAALRRPALPAYAYVLIVATLLVLIYNVAFWREVGGALSGRPVHDTLFMAAFVLFVIALYSALLAPFALRFVLKPLAIALSLTSGAAAYFMVEYGVVIDRVILQSVLETNPAEAADYLNSGLVLYALGFGLVPALLLGAVRIRFAPLARQLGVNALTALAGALIVGVIAMGYYAEFASTFRETPRLRLLLAPLNYLRAATQLVAAETAGPAGPLTVLAPDAVRDDAGAAGRPRTVFVFVVGETARADDFALDGYVRDTNPRLRALPIINFPRVTACGTSTAVSVPCIFSPLTRETFTANRAEASESLLNVLARVGFDVRWRDNNTGCKGVCRGVSFQDLTRLQRPDLCGTGECFDEVLIEDIEALIGNSTRDLFLVLHQKGSHGPAYFRRVPPGFRRFLPMCETPRLQDCTHEQIVNAYDNTMLYTDDVLAQLIEALARVGDRVQTAMLYASDHGESLGERGLYLHGLPNFLAPEQQTHVPMVLWLSPAFQRGYRIDPQCLAREAERPLSHDNLFHSLLGLLRVRTAAYDPRLDFFRPCTT